MTTFPIVTVSGGPRERGRQYGEQARAQIEASIDYYAAYFSAYLGVPWEEVCTRCGVWVPAVDAFAPELIEEVRGIADGAGRSFAEVFALNARGELSYERSLPPRPNEPREPLDGCSSYAVLPEASADRHVWCGQNWDWRARTYPTAVVLRIERAGAPTVMTTVEAGQVCRHGANSAGIALNANGLEGWRKDGRVGVPATFIRRRILDQPSIHRALDVAFRVRQHTPFNLLFTDRAGYALDLETTPERYEWLHPSGGVLVHTNHYQVSVPPQLAETYRPRGADSLFRLHRLEQGLRACRTAGGEGGMRKVLADALRDHFGHPHGVCSHPDQEMSELRQWQTLCSSMVDLTTGEFWLAPGNPCETEYAPLPWNLYDGPFAG